MFFLEAESCMDAAHFLSGYQGKCGNIHGHRWRVLAQICGDELMQDRQNRGMVVDFGKLKEDLRQEVEFFDHSFIIEEDTLKKTTIEALVSEGFDLKFIPFRPTAESFAKYFYEKMSSKGYMVHQITVYETPNNCATYKKDENGWDKR